LGRKGAGAAGEVTSCISVAALTKEVAQGYNDHLKLDEGVKHLDM
jgi:hypothetical protein